MRVLISSKYSRQSRWNGNVEGEMEEAGREAGGGMEEALREAEREVVEAERKNQGASAWHFAVESWYDQPAKAVVRCPAMGFIVVKK